jgi:peroxin-12
MLPLLAHRARIARGAEPDAATSTSAVIDASDAAVEASIARNRRRRRRDLDPAIRPTFFELIAAERLAPSLKGALAYALGTLANAGAPGVAHYALDRGDEVFAALTFLAELKSFASGDGSLAESVYGLQRVPRTLTSAHVRSDGRYRIDGWQRFLSAAILAFGPYARSKAAALHERLAPEQYVDARRRSSVFEASGDRMGLSESEDAAIEAAVRARREARGLRGAATRAFVAAYPAANALAEAATFVTWTGYLLGRWNVNDPTLMLVDCYVTRALPAELEANARELDAYRQRQLAGARASNSAASRALGVGALKTKNFIMDYAQSALIAAVIGFKLTEWWYGAAEERVVGAATLPVPPPPPRPPPHPEGIALPDDTGLCPLCRKQIRNPAVLTCSGYVFCFACVHAHVDRYGDCPVSRHRAFNGVDDIRRVYEGN